MNLLQRPELYLLFLICIITHLHSSQHLPDNLEDDLIAVVLHPESQSKKAYIQNLSLSQLDSLQQSIRSNPERKSTVSFTDKKGPWILGIDTTITASNDKKWPLIIYLHGGIGSPKSDKGSRAFEMMQFLNDKSTQQFLLASPSGNRFAPWWSEEGKERIYTSVRYMLLHYNVDPERIYLAGVSDGGTGVFAIANENYHPFAAFVSISGFGGMLPRFGITFNRSNLQKAPIYMINAGKDRLYPLDYVKQFAANLQSSNIPLTTKYYPEEEHGFSYKTREFEHIHTFLKQRKTTPQIPYHFQVIKKTK